MTFECKSPRTSCLFITLQLEQTTKKKSKFVLLKPLSLYEVTEMPALSKKRAFLHSTAIRIMFMSFKKIFFDFNEKINLICWGPFFGIREVYLVQRTCE